jgi:RecG-like helicase
VVYYSSIKKIKALAKILNYNGYYYAAAKKKEKLRAFITERKKIIIATNILEIKVDIPNIRVI